MEILAKPNRDSEATPPSVGSSRRQRLTEGRYPRRGAAAAAMLLLFLVYNHFGSQLIHNSDNAEKVLAAQDMLRGNWNLHGWTLGPDNFWTLDLTVFAVVMAFRGATPAIMHEVPAAILVFMIACAVWLTRFAREKPVTVRGELLPLSLVGILACPALNSFTFNALACTHILTTAGCLICVGLLHSIATETVGTWRSARIRLCAAALIMMLLRFADPFADIMLTLPLLVVATVGLVRKGMSVGNLATWGVVIAAVALTFALRLLLKWTGGFTTAHGLPTAFTDYRDLFSNIALTIHSLLMICGADFFGRDIASLVTVALLVRFGAVGFLVWCIYRALLRFAIGQDSDWIATVLSVGCAVDFGVCAFSTAFSGFGIAVYRYMAPVAVLGAVVAGRALSATPLAYRRMAGAAIALLLAASVGLLGAWRTSAVLWDSPGNELHASPYQELAKALEARGLRHGYGTYWNAGIVTVESRESVVVRAVLPGLPGMPLWHWLASEAWDQEPRTNPTFLVWDDSDAKDNDVAKLAAKAWGAPSSLFELRSGPYNFHVAVWGKS